MKSAVVLAMILGIGFGERALAFEQQVLSAHYPFPAGGSVSVENIEGAIRVEGWDRAEVEVTVTKTALGSGSRADDVRIVVESAEQAIAFVTLYPTDSREPVRVDYRLRVPRQVRLARLETIDGDIVVHDVEGAVKARSLNGNIQQTAVAGRMTARTINGNIAVSLRALPAPAGLPDRRAPLSLEAVNGNLELLLPPEPNAELELNTVAGRIESNHPLTVSAVPGDSTRRARLGRGGVLIRLRTVRGNIRVREREGLL